jgi:hypothetical protein
VGYAQDIQDSNIKLEKWDEMEKNLSQDEQDFRDIQDNIG